jgi:hypothetical protein
MNRNSPSLWLLSYLLIYIAVSGAVMVTNTTLLGLSDPKFGTNGWVFYWPLWGGMFLPLVFVASFVAEARWQSPSNVRLSFLAGTLASYVVAMEISFVNDFQLPAIAIVLVILAIITVLIGRMWLKRA